MRYTPEQYCLGGVTLKRRLVLVLAMFSCVLLVGWAAQVSTKGAPTASNDAFSRFHAEGFSMMPTIRNGDYLLVFNHAFVSPTSPVRRGDIVAFRVQTNREDFMKRVIGLPGDVVQVKAGKGVWVNGQRLTEPYVLGGRAPDYSWGPKRVPPNKYFVLGDNRNNSYDSHIWGWLPRHLLLGRVLMDYAPRHAVILDNRLKMSPAIAAGVAGIKP